MYNGFTAVDNFHFPKPDCERSQSYNIIFTFYSLKGLCIVFKINMCVYPFLFPLFGPSINWKYARNEQLLEKEIPKKIRRNL